jgi:hypothetical protein
VKLGLQIERELANFIQEYRSIARSYEQSVFCLSRSRKCASHIAEKLALNQSGHERSAIDWQKRFFGVGAEGVNCARHHLLARAALAEDQHRVSGLRHFGQNPVELLHLRSATHHLPHPVLQLQALSQLPRFVVNVTVHASPFQCGGELIQSERFVQVVGSPAMHRSQGH